MTALVAVEGVGRRFGDRDVLVSVALRLEPAEAVSLLGPSGCGKTTLLQILGLLDRPSRGRVLVGDLDAATFSAAVCAELRLQRFGFVFQNGHLLEQLTARDNVALPAWRLGGSRRAATRRADELLERLGLAARACARARELSVGEAQRVAVARALVNRPRIVLADEPTGNLDSEAAREVMGALRALRETGSALFVATHDAGVAASADRVLRLEDGRLA